MAKVKKNSVSAPSNPAKKTFNKSKSFSGVISTDISHKGIQKNKKLTRKLNTSKKVDAIKQNISLKDTGKINTDKKKSKTISTPASVLKKKKSEDLPTPKPLKKAKETVQVTGRLNIAALQERYNVKVEDVKKAVKGVIKLREKNPKLEKQLFEERCPLFLQISCVKLPKGQSKILRIPLPHSVLTPDDEVCVIVPEVKGIKNIEHEKHVEHYEDLFRNKGVTNIKKIMTCHELRTEYETFEQKSRLVDLYDIFLVDGKVSGKVVKKCGKPFYKKRKVPIPVKLHVTNLKEHIEKSLSKVFFFLHLKGDSYSVQFGHNKMKVQHLVENIYCIIDALDKQFPGGVANFKGIQVMAPGASSIPIYLSFKSPNEVKVPDVTPKKPKAYKTYKDELTTLYNAEVTVKPTGEVLVKRQRGKADAENDDTITDLDIIKANKDHDESNDESKTKKKRRRKHKESIEGGEDSDGILKKKKKVADNEESQGVVENKLKKKKGNKTTKKVLKDANGINEAKNELTKKKSIKKVAKKSLKGVASKENETDDTSNRVKRSVFLLPKKVKHVLENEKTGKKKKKTSA